MFFKRFGMLILTVIAFTSGAIVTTQWIGSDYGIDLYNLLKRPEVVEKIVEIEVVKVVTISQDQKIQMINQEYRDALLKISAINYNSGSTKATHSSMQQYALKALSTPKIVYKTELK